MKKPLFTPLIPDEPEFVEYRQWIENLFQELPSKHHKTFCGRLSSKKSNEFQSTLFEMQLYRMLKRLDLDVEIEGELLGTKKKIDFHVQNDRQSCFIEATVCGFGQGEFSDTDQEYDAITKLKKGLPNPHLDIWLEAEGQLKKYLRKSEIISPFRELLARFTREEFEENSKLPWFYPEYILFEEKCKTEIRVGGWTLKGSLALPCSERGGQIHLPSRGGPADSSGPLLRSVQAKARHWSGTDLGQPFVVAVNNCHSEFHWDSDDASIKRALMGDPDAADHAIFQPALHRISGVIVVGKAYIGAEKGARIKLFRNGNKETPDFLHFLEEKQTFGNLL